MTTARRVPLAILLASLALIAGAFFFEYVVKLEPCELCLAQRWPYYLAIAAALAALIGGPRVTPWCVAIAALLFATGAGLAAYHVGVEQHWIAGPTACTDASGPGATSPEELLKLLRRQPVRCDEVQWSLFGISLAGWNLLASLALLAFTALGLRQLLRERTT